MLPGIDRFVFRPLVAFWLRFAANSWHRLPLAADSPHVHAPGTNPDRILVTGDGASAGRGVLTHDLGLPGYLARSVSSLTGRAADVDIVVTGTMTARKCSDAIAGLDLNRFDAVLLSLGAVEALAFTPEKQWTRDLSILLDRIERDAPDSTVTFALSIPFFAPHRLFPTLLARACDRQVSRLNRATQQVIASRTRVKYVVVGETAALESSGAHTYDLWATSVAPHIADTLAREKRPNPRDQAEREGERQAALEALDVLDLPTDPVFENLTRRARELFGTAFAAITLIDGPRQKIASASGMPTDDMARQESFCDVTIRREEHLAIEDTLLDPRYANLRVVNSGPRVRFYAGYPIESPDGHRVGALCVLDPEPRRFSDDDAVLLRLLAQETQRRLWELSEAAIALREDKPDPPTPASQLTDPVALPRQQPSTG